MVWVLFPGAKLPLLNPGAKIVVAGDAAAQIGYLSRLQRRNGPSTDAQERVLTQHSVTMRVFSPSEVMFLVSL